MFELKVFQSKSAKTIADRFAFFASHPERPMRGIKPRPFFQALSALTGAGKTPILAQAVSLIRNQFGSEPIILWMSKAKSVVAQTYSNFSPGGKYEPLLDGFKVISIQELSPQLIADGSTPLLVMTTTGLFNNKDQSEGALNIYKKDNDLFGDESPWDRLIARKNNEETRRPLLIVYDEGHNLSEQQTNLLAELEPDAYLLASATLKLPVNFQKSVIKPIKLWVEECGQTTAFSQINAIDEDGSPSPERFITVTVDSEKVVEAQLVKKAIQFDGTTAPMEKCLDELIKRRELLKEEITRCGLAITPKAIYVCKTNIADDGEKDDSSKPFHLRKAPPIRIWRYLVEEKGVSPKEIAIYANLSFSGGSKPEEVNLYSKGESDFDEFQSHNYQHIIFNLSLQEGWDDPACYLAYIDKSMGSSIQVEQIIGRVLRQYNATHYESPLLNSAHFFIRVDNQSVFTEAINNVRGKLNSEGAPIEIIENFNLGDSGALDLSPNNIPSSGLHHIFVDSESARKKIAEITLNFPIFSEGDPNTLGNAQSATEIVDLTTLKSNNSVTWKSEGFTNPVRIRWLINNAIRSRSSRALAIMDLKDSKFDTRVQIQSIADKLANEFAKDVVRAFYDYSDLVYESNKEFSFGILRTPRNAQQFNNSIYEKYASLNKLELNFAHALDKTNFIWHRNPSSGGFYIPLLDEGDTSSFYPDFIVWKDDLVFCLDTKGGHLISDAVARKLFDIKDGNTTKVLVRFITEGKQTELRGKVIKGGFTVWKMKGGNPKPIHVTDIENAVMECMKN
jgi:type III restriction enzyme